MNRIAATVVLVVAFALPFALAERPPQFMNYQGVLRNAAGTPLDGSYSMTFRFYPALTGGQSILANEQQVQVTDGLFSVAIGNGTVVDGDGPGYYRYLPSVFGDFNLVFLEIEINGEILSPRTRVTSAAYAFNSRYVNGVEVAELEALDLWVDAVNGNDNNSGLLPSAAKQTIQAAVDRVPSILGDDITVHIQPGTYAETVYLLDRNFRRDSTLALVATAPGVRITGGLVRDDGIVIDDVGNFLVEGIEVLDTLSYNMRITNSTGTVRSCNLTTSVGVQPTGRGVLVTRAFVTIEDSTISQHVPDGLVCSSASRCFLDDVVITGNTRGMDVLKAAQVRFVGPAVVSANGIGCRAYGHGEIDFGYRSDVFVTGNSAYDLYSHLLSTIFGYQPSSVGGCVATDYSICSATYLAE